MAEVWIYGEDGAPASQMAVTVAELGLTPRQIQADGGLRPDDASARPPDLAVVIDNEELCGRLRGDDALAEVPILLSIRAENLDGRHLDAEELLIPPFTSAELEVRIVRARRQLGGGTATQTIRAGSLEVDLVTYQVTVDGEPVDFAFKEYELLRFLVTHPARVYSREALLKAVWGYDYYGGARTVDVHVRRLRAKLGPEHAGRIRTIRGVGYRFDI